MRYRGRLSAMILQCLDDLIRDNHPQVVHGIAVSRNRRDHGTHRKLANDDRGVLGRRLRTLAARNEVDR
jgi:hypothetical protein